MRMFLLTSLLLAACSPAEGGSAAGDVARVSPAISDDLARVRNARILFSHQSVGRNLLEGIAGLDASAGNGKLQWLTLEQAKRAAGAGMIDVSGGSNGQPRSKIDFFVATLRELKAMPPAVAFMKLCYVDFDPNSDVDALFQRYREALVALQAEYPAVTFVHVTAPLRQRPDDLVSRAKRVLGRAVWDDDANAKRARFNELLLRSFPSHLVFDLARAESTRPDGTRELLLRDGRSVPSLAAAYTQDGGHLNTLGQGVIGAQLLHFLAQLAPPRAD